MARVLVVEDDHAICRLISDILEDAGLETRCVQSDKAAYAALPTTPAYCALIVDINLGKGTTGFDVARRARQIAPHIPIIYISGEASAASVKTFGVPDSDYLQKPFTPEEMVRTLQARLKPEGAA